MTRDGVAGLISLALSLGMLVLSRGLPKSSFVPVGPDFYPRIVLVIMALLSLMLIGTDLWRQHFSKKAAAATTQAAPEEKRNYGLVAATYAIFTGYVVLLPLVGYRVSTFLFVLALQPTLEPPRTAGRWVFVVISALAASAITYMVFDQYLDVLLPRGSWTDW